MKQLLATYLISTVLLSACTNNDTPAEPPVTPVSTAKNISYSIITTYPHDTSSYTQGLIVYKDGLYEGTGLEGKSKLMKTDLKTGKALQKIDLDKQYFGEGVTILNDTVYQLTWQNKKAFSYSLKDFKKIKEFTVNHDGWGLTNDGKNLVASDGSSTIYFYNTSFELIKTISVNDGGVPESNINELEFIDGYIYANKYQTPYIFKIDPSNGSIIGKIDLTDVWKRVQLIDPQADVPNGIAYDSTANKIYITGKLWPELYEIQLSK